MRVDVDVRPMRRGAPLLEDLLLLRELVGRGHGGRGVAGVDDGADGVGGRVDGVVHLPTVPENQIARLGADLD